MSKNPWDRIDGETMAAFEAFVIYRDLGPGRSLSKAAQPLAKTAGTLAEWSAKYSWATRAQAWDDHLDKIIQTATEKTVAKAQSDVIKNHLKIADLMIGVGASQLNKWGRQVEQWQEKGAKVEEYPLNLTPRDAASLIEKGIMLRRLSEGQSTSNENVTLDQPRRYVVVMPSDPKTEEGTQE